MCDIPVQCTVYNVHSYNNHYCKLNIAWVDVGMRRYITGSWWHNYRSSLRDGCESLLVSRFIISLLFWFYPWTCNLQYRKLRSIKLQWQTTVTTEFYWINPLEYYVVFSIIHMFHWVYNTYYIIVCIVWNGDLLKEISKLKFEMINILLL